MDALIYGIWAVYDWLHIQFNVFGYNISLWELIIFSLIVSVLMFIVRQIYNIED